MKAPIAALAAAALLVSACATNQQTGALVGGTGGAVLGGLAGQALGGRSGALIGALAGGTAGLLAGSLIGKELDDRDRLKAEAATQQALMAPPNAPPATWASQDKPNVRGQARVVAVQRQPAGGECRSVRETAYIQGREVVQNMRYCQNAEGQWSARS
jgi:surface antigen